MEDLKDEPKNTPGFEESLTPMETESSPSPEMGSRRKPSKPDSQILALSPSSPTFEKPAKSPRVSEQRVERFGQRVQKPKRRRLYSQSPPQRDRECLTRGNLMASSSSSSSSHYHGHSQSRHHGHSHYQSQSHSHQSHSQSHSHQSHFQSHSHGHQPTRKRSNSRRDCDQRTSRSITLLTVKYSPVTQSAYFLLKQWQPTVGRVMSYCWKIKTKCISKDRNDKHRANTLFGRLFKMVHKYQEKLVFRWNVGDQLEQISRSQHKRLAEDIYQMNRECELVRIFVFYF